MIRRQITGLMYFSYKGLLKNTAQLFILEPGDRAKPAAAGS